MKKVRVGWFSFSCCEDSTIIFTELLNDHHKEWKEKIDFISMLVLQRRESLEDLDIAFVEGAITADEQLERLKVIRGKAKKLIAIGACACVGLPSAQRNEFDEGKKQEIQFLIERFKMSPMVKKLADCVSVDDSVPGCPMDENRFLMIMDKYLTEFFVP